MKRLGLILALLIIVLGAWIDWSYRAARTAIAEIGPRLPSEEALNAMPLDQTVETLKQAVADCQRVDSFKWNPLTRLLKGDELKSLTEHCELIKGRQDALQGP
ncbi:MAG: hypothetical protein WBW51_01045 [Methyloceanibacter sp.]